MKIELTFFAISVAIVMGQNDCGTLLTGSIYPNVADQNSFYQCNNGQAILIACPASFIFNSQSSFCVNPCDTPTGGTAMNPNDDTSYLICENNNGIWTWSGELGKCGADEKFYQALVGVIGNGCYPSKSIEICPPGSSSTTIKLLPRENCPITNIYIDCYNGVASVRKCPYSSVFDSGACLAAPGACPSTVTEIQDCMCN